MDKMPDSASTDPAPRFRATAPDFRPRYVVMARLPQLPVPPIGPVEITPPDAADDAERISLKVLRVRATPSEGAIHHPGPVAAANMEQGALPAGEFAVPAAPRSTHVGALPSFASATVPLRKVGQTSFIRRVVAARASRASCSQGEAAAAATSVQADARMEQSLAPVHGGRGRGKAPPLSGPIAPYYVYPREDDTPSPALVAGVPREGPSSNSPPSPRPHALHALCASAVDALSSVQALSTLERWYRTWPGHEWLQAIDGKDTGGDRPLHAAVRSGRLELVEFLTTAGADTWARGAEGATPLHLAASRGMRGITAFLALGAGCSGRADPNCRMKGGYTPLHLALAHCVVDGEGGCWEVLLQGRADPNACSDDKLTPLLIAAACTAGQRGPRTAVGERIIHALVAAGAGIVGALHHPPPSDVPSGALPLLLRPSTYYESYVFGSSVGRVRGSSDTVARTRVHGRKKGSLGRGSAYASASSTPTDACEGAPDAMCVAALSSPLHLFCSLGLSTALQACLRSVRDAHLPDSEGEEEEEGGACPWAFTWRDEWVRGSGRGRAGRGAEEDYADISACVTAAPSSYSPILHALLTSHWGEDGGREPREGRSTPLHAALQALSSAAGGGEGTSLLPGLLQCVHVLCCVAGAAVCGPALSKAPLACVGGGGRRGLQTSPGVLEEPLRRVLAALARMRGGAATEPCAWSLLPPAPPSSCAAVWAPPPVLVYAAHVEVQAMLAAARGSRSAPAMSIQSQAVCARLLPTWSCPVPQQPGAALARVLARVRPSQGPVPVPQVWMGEGVDLGMCVRPFMDGEATPVHVPSTLPPGLLTAVLVPAPDVAFGWAGTELATCVSVEILGEGEGQGGWLHCAHPSYARLGHPLSCWGGAGQLGLLGHATPPTPSYAVSAGVLSARSPYFHALLASDWARGEQPHLHVHVPNAPALACLLSWATTGCLLPPVHCANGYTHAANGALSTGDDVVGMYAACVWESMSGWVRVQDEGGAVDHPAPILSAVELPLPLPALLALDTALLALQLGLTACAAQAERALVALMTEGGGTRGLRAPPACTQLARALAPAMIHAADALIERGGGGGEGWVGTALHRACTRALKEGMGAAGGWRLTTLRQGVGVGAACPSMAKAMATLGCGPCESPSGIGRGGYHDTFEGLWRDLRASWLGGQAVDTVPVTLALTLPQPSTHAPVAVSAVVRVHAAVLYASMGLGEGGGGGGVHLRVALPTPTPQCAQHCSAASREAVSECWGRACAAWAVGVYHGDGVEGEGEARDRVQVVQGTGPPPGPSMSDHAHACAGCWSCALPALYLSVGARNVSVLLLTLPLSIACIRKSAHAPAASETLARACIAIGRWGEECAKGALLSACAALACVRDLHNDVIKLVCGTEGAGGGGADMKAACAALGQAVRTLTTACFSIAVSAYSAGVDATGSLPCSPCSDMENEIVSTTCDVELDKKAKRIVPFSPEQARHLLWIIMGADAPVIA